MVSSLLGLARTAGVRPVATNDVRYAVPEDAVVYDVLVLSRNRLTVHDDHPERLWSREAWLKPRYELEPLIRSSQAFTNTLEIARECRLELLPGRVQSPRANLTPGEDANSVLEGLVREGVKRRYPVSTNPASRDLTSKRREALNLMAHELEVIAEIHLAEFFLVVHEIVTAASWP